MVEVTITQADRDAVAEYNRCFPEICITDAFARHRIAAEQAALRKGIRMGIEASAKVPEKRAEERFDEYGTREPDTNATYYSGRRGETLEELDEECESIARDIRALADDVEAIVKEAE